MASAGRDNDEIGRYRDQMIERAAARRRGELPAREPLAERRQRRDGETRQLLDGQRQILQRLNAIDGKADAACEIAQQALDAVKGAYAAAGLAGPAVPEPRRPDLKLIRGEAV